jgi:hypothetical protein
MPTKQHPIGVAALFFAVFSLRRRLSFALLVDFYLLLWYSHSAR